MKIYQYISAFNKRRLWRMRDRRTRYAEWIKCYERDYIEKIRSLAGKDKMCSEGPLISVIMPVYKPDLDFLKKAIGSVREQIYQNWELCICDDFSNCENTSNFLARQAALDHRIKVVTRAENGHISRASNDAIAISTGEFVALLDQDDLLSEHALFLVARTVIRNPSACVIYSDEDKLKGDDFRCGPYFKPDWNIHLFRSHNLISHLGVYRRELVLSVGGFRVGLEGSQDYDLALRCVEKVEDSQIVHIPHVLYHWRIHAASTSSGIEAKPYAITAAERALVEHLQRLGIGGKVNANVSGGYRIDYDRRPSSVAVVLDGTNANKQQLEIFVESFVRLTDFPDYSLSFVDRQKLTVFQICKGKVSSVETVLLKSETAEDVDCLLVRELACEFVCFLGDVKPLHVDWLHNFVGLIQQDNVGVVGGKLVSDRNRIVHAGYALGGEKLYLGVDSVDRKNGYAGRAGVVREVAACSSECMIVNAKLFLESGGWRSELKSTVLRDIDFCLRVRAKNHKVVLNPYSVFDSKIRLDRQGGVQSGARINSAMHRESVSKFRQIWGELSDNFHNPNVSLNCRRFRLDPDESRNAFMTHGSRYDVDG